MVERFTANLHSRASVRLVLKVRAVQALSAGYHIPSVDV